MECWLFVGAFLKFMCLVGALYLTASNIHKVIRKEDADKTPWITWALFVASFLFMHWKGAIL